MEKKLEEYIKKFEKDYNFYFVKDIKLKEILYSFYGYVLFVYLEEIKY
ncbi:MAG: hypothetical protein LBD88_03970 [Candidatus Peribacteria bacterium]|nr:hypothetical protein [Candidatus Peribacteria bacterium]